jgi:hypothetical protein
MSIPYREKTIHWQNFNYAGYLSSIDYSSYPRLPNHWTPIGTLGDISIESEEYLEFYGTNPTEIIYTGTEADISTTDGYSNYGVSLIFQCNAGTKLSLLFKHNGETIAGTDKGIKLTLDHITDIISLTEYNNSVPSTSLLTSAPHEIEDNDFYQLEIWSYEGKLYAWINEYLIFNGIDYSSGYNINTHFGILNDSQHTAIRTHTRLFNLQVFSTVDQPGLAYEADPTDLLTQFRKELQTQVNTVTHDSWTQFNYAFKHWLRHKDTGRSDNTWWNNGYPLRKPSTEEWLV